MKVVSKELSNMCLALLQSNPVSKRKLLHKYIFHFLHPVLILSLILFVHLHLVPTNEVHLSNSAQKQIRGSVVLFQIIR